MMSPINCAGHVKLVDATLIPSAGIRQDDEAQWAGHRGRKPVHGYKAHVVTDQDTALIDTVEGDYRQRLRLVHHRFRQWFHQAQ